jgi:hypothetical protein
VRQPLVATSLAVLNSAILALLDYSQVTNARRAIRTFAAYLEQSLALPYSTPMTFEKPWRSLCGWSMAVVATEGTVNDPSSVCHWPER